MLKTADFKQKLWAEIEQLSPDDAYECLKLRLSEKEMEAIYRDQYEKIAQRQLRQHINELG